MNKIELNSFEAENSITLLLNLPRAQFFYIKHERFYFGFPSGRPCSFNRKKPIPCFIFSCSSKIHKCFYISIYRDNNAHLFRTEGQHTPNNSRVSAKNNVPLRWLITVYATTLWQLQWKFQNNSRVQHKNDIQTENSHKNQNYTTTERKFFSFLKFDFRSDSHFFFCSITVR